MRAPILCGTVLLVLLQASLGSFDVRLEKPHELSLLDESPTKDPSVEVENGDGQDAEQSENALDKDPTDEKGNTPSDKDPETADMPEVDDTSASTNSTAGESDRNATIQKTKVANPPSNVSDVDNQIKEFRNSSSTDSASANSDKVLKKKLDTWKEHIATLKDKLSEASANTAKAKADADRAIKADKELRKDINRQQEKTDRKAALADQKVDKTIRPAVVDEQKLASEGKKVQTAQNDAQAKLTDTSALLKIKNLADEKYAKAKTQHALEGADEVPDADPEKLQSLFKSLEAAAKDKNAADLNYSNAKKQLKNATKVAKAATKKLSTDEALVTPSLVKSAAKAEQKAIRLDRKANNERLNALKVITDADEKVHRKMKRQQELAHQIVKIEAKRKRAVFRVRQVKEKTMKLKVNAREKRSKADAIRGARKQAENQMDAEEADFSLATMANRIRAAKSSHEAGVKKTVVAQHTLDVLQEIDKAAKKEANMVEAYHAKESKEKGEAKTVASKGELKLRRAAQALKRVTDAAVNEVHGTT